MPSSNLTGGPSFDGVKSSYPWAGMIHFDTDGYAGRTIGEAFQNFNAGNSVNIPDGTPVQVLGDSDQLDGFGSRAGDYTPSQWRPVHITGADSGLDTSQQYWVSSSNVDVENDLVGYDVNAVATNDVATITANKLPPSNSGWEILILLIVLGVAVASK